MNFDKLNILNKNYKKTLILLFLIIFIIIVSYFLIPKKINQNSKEINFMSLSYLDFYKIDTANNESGVIIYNKNKSYEGYNIYANKIMDMNGNIVFTLSGPESLIMENGIIFTSKLKYKTNNFLYSTINNSFNINLVCYENNTLLWTSKDVFHHDMDIDINRNLLFLSRELINYSRYPLISDVILMYDQKGNYLEKWEVFEHIDEINMYYHNKNIADNIKNKISYYSNPNDFVYDYFHANYISVISENELGKIDTRFKKGNWMISLSQLNLIIIVDNETKKIVWGFGDGVFDGIHGPQMLNNGNIIVFNNGWSSNKNISSVIEFNPITGKIIWNYSNSNFYSENRGYAQRLPNGNTLITESTKGHVFEVTPEKEIVWEWYNPEINNNESWRKITYRMTRQSKEDIELFMNGKVMNKYIKS